MTGKELITKIRSHGISLKAIADITGLSYGGIKKLSRGERKGSKATIGKLESLLSDVEEMAKTLPSMQGGGGGGKRKKVAVAGAGGEERRKREKYKIFFKSVKMKIIYERYYKIKERDYDSVCFKVEVILIKFYDKIEKLIKNENLEKYICHAKVYFEGGNSGNITLNRYFSKSEFLTNIQSFIKEARYNLCEFINGLANSDKRVDEIRLTFLGYVEKIKQSKRKKK